MRYASLGNNLSSFNLILFLLVYLIFSSLYVLIACLLFFSPSVLTSYLLLLFVFQDDPYKDHNSPISYITPIASFLALFIVLGSEHRSTSSHAVYPFTLNMRATYPSQRLVFMYRTTRCHALKDSTMQ